MARNLTIWTIFKAKDKAIQPTKNLQKRLKRVGKTAIKTSSKIGSVFKGVLGAQLALGALRKVGQGLSFVKDEFISFDQAITAAGAKFGDAFKRGTKGAEELRKVTRGIGAETEFSATEAAEGLDFLAMAGFNAAQSMALLPGVVDLATSTQQDLARSTDIASDALGAFGLMTKDSAQLTTNFNRILDVMSKTTTTANTDMEALFEAVKKGAPTFTSAGQSVETFNALVGTMANSGIKGSEAGTQLRNMMLRLGSPTKQAQSVLNKLNITTKDSDGNFRDAIDILGDFQKATKDMGTAQKTAALSTVFGARTVNGINVLLKEGADSLREYRTQLEGAGGSSKELAEEMRKSLGNSLAKIKSALIELGFKFFDVFGDKITMALAGISKLIDKLNSLFGANQKIIAQGFDKTFGFIAEKIKIVFDIVSQIITKFTEVGKQQGLFVNLEKTIQSLKETFDVYFEVLKDIWATLKESGVIDIVVAKFNKFVSILRITLITIKPLLKLIGFLFKVLMKIISPFLKLTAAFEKIGGGVLGKIADKLAGKPEEKGEPGPGEPEEEFEPQSTQARLTNAGINNNTTNTNISESRVQLDFNNLPENARVRTKGDMRGVKLDTGRQR
jgi:TP901 family phage tail tape measure protein